MDVRAFAAWGLIAVALLHLSGCSKSSPSPKPPPGPKQDNWLHEIGVSLAGGEFGSDRPRFSNKHPGSHGKDYIYCRSATMRYFTHHQVRVFRIPIRWERIQPRLQGELDRAELKRLKQIVEAARAHDASIIFDLHNYGAYHLEGRGGVVKAPVDEPVDGEVLVTGEDLADCWRRLAEVFRDEPAVVAYGLMNEPHSMKGHSWHAVSRQIVEAIREIDSWTWVLVSGEEWANTVTFPEVNGEEAWIDRSIPNVAYEAHCYFDFDNSGKYVLDFEMEDRIATDLAERSINRVRPFVEWCQANEVPGYVGEFGVPGNDARWLDVLRPFLEYLADNGTGGCYWAAGQWWGAYPLSIHPKSPTSEPAPQLVVIKEVAAMDRCKAPAQVSEE